MKSLTITHKDLDNAIAARTRAGSYITHCVIACAARRQTRNFVAVAPRGISIFKIRHGKDSTSTFVTGDPFFGVIIKWFDNNEMEKIRKLLPLTIYGFVPSRELV